MTDRRKPRASRVLLPPVIDCQEGCLEFITSRPSLTPFIVVVEVAVGWRSNTGRGGMLRIREGIRRGLGGMLRGLGGLLGMEVDAGGGGTGTYGSGSSLPSDAAIR